MDPGFESKVEALTRCVEMIDDPMGFLEKGAGERKKGLTEGAHCLKPHLEVNQPLNVFLVPVDKPPVSLSTNITDCLFLIMLCLLV